MQKNDFEKQVQQQLEDFSLPPADAVWQKVADKVAQDKKRRRIFAWMFVGILLLGGAGFWLISNKHDNKIASTIEKANVINVDKKRSIEETKKDTKGLVNEENAEPKNKKSKTKNVEKDLKPVQSAIALAPVIKKINDERNGTRKVQSNPKIVDKEVEEDVELNQPTKVVALDKLTATTDSSSVIDESRKAEEATQTNPNADDKSMSSTEEKSTTEIVEANSQAVKKVANNKKRLIFGATVLAGISDNRNARLFSMNKSADALFYNSPSAGQSSQPAFNYYPRYQYSSSYSWGAGVFAQQEISKKFSISVGLNYQLMSSNLATGSRVDSLRTFTDSLLMKTAIVANFYRGGESQEYRNRYHLLQLPVNVLFRLNKNEGKPFTLSTGLTAGVLFGSNALYFNDRARAYYKETKQFSRLSLSAQTGLSFTLYNTPQYQLQLGPVAQYQLSNLTKHAINSNEHLLFFGLKGNILFKSFNK